MKARPDMPVPADPLIGDRLHLCAGAECNNNCLFCMEDDREARRRRVHAQTREDIRGMMATPGAREVMFTSGEPTLNEGLIDLIRMAREAGFERIGMITNGRRLAYAPYTRTLLSAGLNHVLVSIHGHDAATHDALTRTRGAFDQAVRGLANLAALKADFPGLRVHTATVVNRHNLAFLNEFHDAMRPFDVDQHVFNVVMPEGRGLSHFDTLMPRYSDVASEFERFIWGLVPAETGRVFLLDIPYCTTEALPDSVRGYVERYFHFEPEADRYAMVTRSEHDSLVRLKRQDCARCGYEGRCRGVFRVYVERFGWGEFEPVRYGS